MTTITFNEQLDELVQKKKRQSFHHPETIQDSEALGVLVSGYFKWSGEPIIQAFMGALHDANFHELAYEIEQTCFRAVSKQ